MMSRHFYQQKGLLETQESILGLVPVWKFYEVELTKEQVAGSQLLEDHPNPFQLGLKLHWHGLFGQIG